MLPAAGIIAAAMLLAALSGCSAESSVKSATSDNEERVCDFYRAVDAGDAPDIYLITKALNNTYWDSLIEGACDSARDLGVNLYVGGTYRESYVDELRKLIREAGEKKPAAVIVSPQNTAGIIQEINDIKRSGIVVIFVDSFLNDADFDMCYMTDNINAGRLVAENVLKSLQEEGTDESEELQIGIEVGSMQSQTIMERLAGFNGYWSRSAPDSWKVIEDISSNDGDVAVAESDARNYMSYPALKVLLGLNNGSTVGIANAVAAEERKDLIVVGFDYSDEIARLIDDGSYNASTVVQRQYDMGAKSVESALDFANGAGSVYKYVDTGVEFITKDDVNE